MLESTMIRRRCSFQRQVRILPGATTSSCGSMSRPGKLFGEIVRLWQEGVGALSGISGQMLESTMIRRRCSFQRQVKISLGTTANKLDRCEDRQMHLPRVRAAAHGAAADTGHDGQSHRCSKNNWQLSQHRRRRRGLHIWSRRTSLRRRSTSNGGQSFHRQNENAHDISNHHPQGRDQRVQVSSLHLFAVHVPLRVTSDM
jgi:hypothetical protein